MRSAILVNGVYYMRFEWDTEKNKSNIRKHRVSFEDAETVFKDDNLIIMFDDAHSTYEERFNAIGEDLIHCRLIVCHCYRIDNAEEDIVRIISARIANKNETDIYERGLGL